MIPNWMRKMFGFCKDRYLRWRYPYIKRVRLIENENLGDSAGIVVQRRADGQEVVLLSQEQKPAMGLPPKVFLATPWSRPSTGEIYLDPYYQPNWDQLSQQ